MRDKAQRVQRLLETIGGARFTREEAALVVVALRAAADCLEDDIGLAGDNAGAGAAFPVGAGKMRQDRASRRNSERTAPALDA